MFDRSKIQRAGVVAGEKIVVGLMTDRVQCTRRTKTHRAVSLRELQRIAPDRTGGVTDSWPRCARSVLAAGAAAPSPPYTVAAAPGRRPGPRHRGCRTAPAQRPRAH